MIEIRKAKLGDLDRIKELNLKLFNQQHAMDDTVSLDWTYAEETSEYFVKAIDSEKRNWLVALEDDIIIGYMAFTLMATPKYMDQGLVMAELEHTYIEEEYRSRGLGTQMLNELTRWAKDKGVNLLTVTTSYENKKAQKFYESGGMIKTDVTFQKKI